MPRDFSRPRVRDLWPRLLRASEAARTGYTRRFGQARARAESSGPLIAGHDYGGECRRVDGRSYHALIYARWPRVIRALTAAALNFCGRFGDLSWERENRPGIRAKNYLYK